MRLTDEQIATELRALRETPTEHFSAELDAWAAAGFPRISDLDEAESPDSAPSGWRVRLGELRRRRLALGFAGGVAVVASFAIAVVVSLQSYTGDEELSLDSAGTDSGAGQELGRESGRGAAGAEAVAPDSAIEPAPSTIPPVPPQEQLKPGQERIEEKSASMTLSTDPGDVDDVADEVVDVVDRYKGIVVSSDVNTSERRSRATFDLRIPTANLQATLSDLSDLASVSSRDEGTLDITAPFITAEERFDDAKAEVDALLGQLAEADSSTEIAEIRAQLQTARAELAAARAELGALKQRADFSKLSLTVVGDGDADGWSLGDAADDALSVLEDLAGAILIALAVIVPLGAIAIGGWLGLGALQRRRRERALDK